MELVHALRDLYGGNRHEVATDRIELDEETLYGLLADSRRRFVIEQLASRGEVTCTELAIDVAAAETHTRREHVAQRRVVPVEGDLRNEQLPRLADAGVVRWDARSDRIRPGHSVVEIAKLLREVARRTADGRWAEGSPFAVGASSDDWGTQQSQTSSGRYHS